MRKPSITDHLSEKEKKGAVEAALKGGMEHMKSSRPFFKMFTE